LAFNKSKDLNTIQKLIQRGQIDKAIKKLEGVINVDPNDASLYIKIGDLYLRKGNKDGAKDAYFKAANMYLKDGYNNRAIATYKMASRIDPEDLVVCQSIAELFEKQGLIGDALQQYKYAATIFDQQGNTDEMAKVLEKILTLDPDNTPAKLKIAEAHFNKDKKSDAYAILSGIAKDLKRKKLYSDCVTAFEIFLEKDKNDPFILKELAHAYIMTDNPKKGLKLIQAAQKNNPEDIETLLILAETFLMLDKLNDSETIYCDILRKDEKNYKAKFGLSKIFLKKDNIDEALRSIEPFYHEFEEHGELAQLADFYESALTQSPTNTDILEKLGEIYRYQNNTVSLILVYEKLADFYESGDQKDKATFLYQKIIQINPNHEKAKSYLHKNGTVSFDELAGGAEELGEEAINEHITEANVYLKYGLYDQAKEHIDSILGSDSENVEAHHALKDIYVGQGEKELAISELFLLCDLAPVNKDNYLNEILKLDPENADAKEKLGGAAAAPAEAAPAEKAKEKPEKKAETFEGIDLIVEEPEELKEKEEGKPAKKTLEAELEEAEFYFAEGLYDDAKKIYKKVLLNDPYNMQAVEKLEQIERSTTKTGPELEPVTSQETHGEEFFDFAKELEESLPDDLLGEPSPDKKAPAGDRHETDDIFSKFKKGIEENIDSKDYDSHYNLGIAYKEMGLLEDSLDEFKKAFSADQTKVLECCTMLGMVSLQTAMYEDAIKYFEKIFKEVTLPEEQINDLRYELATAYQENGQHEQSLKNFNMILEKDPSFRDVKEKIQLVMNSKEHSTNEKKTEKKRKISYV
jgi:tetratricopeptide (TPR) repeat protein